MHKLLPLLLIGCVTPPVDKSPEESGTDSDPPGHTDEETAAHTDVPDDSGGGDDTVGETAYEFGGGPAVILFIGDGMGFPHVAGGGLYKNGATGSLEMEKLPFHGQLRTASLNGITDSAAAGTVYACGEKTWNGSLGLDKDDNDLTSVVDTARSLGMKVGIVTTDTLTGATPASFMVTVNSRGDTEEISNEIIAELPNVMLGGGSTTLAPLVEGLDLRLATDASTLDATLYDERPLVGLFASYTFPWVADGYTTEPTLAQMTSKALDELNHSDEGFFLMVEGARIDHASHANRTENVHQETAAFDDAIAAAMAWSAGREDTTIVVTADHECGGMMVADAGVAGEIPETSWRWNVHTNADVPVFAMGERASLLDGQRLDALWVHEVLAAAIEEREVTDPHIVPLVDGWLDDLGPAISTQTHATSFGSGFNQLDGLHLDADEDGLRIGVDGAFDRQENLVVLLIDLDYGEGTGLGAGTTALPDMDGMLETALSNLNLDVGIDGLGFDLAIATSAATEVETRDLSDSSGLRGLRDPWAYDGDLWWLASIVNLDYGNVAIAGDEAPDAGATGETVDGLEAMLWWSVVDDSGLLDEGLNVAVVALLVNSDGTWASNQALPPLTDADEPGASAIPITAAALITVDADGVMVGEPEIIE